MFKIVGEFWDRLGKSTIWDFTPDSLIGPMEIAIHSHHRERREYLSETDKNG